MQWMWFVLSVVVFTSCESSFAERPYYRRYYNGGGTDYRNHHQVAPSGEYETVHRYGTQSGSIGTRSGSVGVGNHGYQVGRDYQVLKNGRPLQSGSYRYNGGQNATYYNPSDIKGDAVRNEQRAKDLQTIANGRAEYESTVTVYQDQVNTGTLRTSRNEKALIADFSNDLEILFDLAEKSALARSSSEKRQIELEARALARNMHGKMSRAYQSGLIPYEILRNMEDKWGPLLR